MDISPLRVEYLKVPTLILCRHTHFRVSNLRHTLVDAVESALLSKREGDLERDEERRRNPRQTNTCSRQSSSTRSSLNEMYSHPPPVLLLL